MDSRLGDCAEISAGREKQTQEADATKGEIVRTWGPAVLDPYEETQEHRLKPMLQESNAGFESADSNGKGRGSIERSDWM